MSEIDYGKRLSLSSKCFIIAFIALAFIAAFIPLWQMGVTNSLKHKIVYSNNSLQDLDREERALRAAIAVESNDFKGNVVLKASK